MLRRAAVLLVLGSVLGILFATLMGPRPARGEEAPPELKAEPARPSAAAKVLSRPMIDATAKVKPGVVRVLGRYNHPLRGAVDADIGSGFIVSTAGHVLTNRHVVSAVQGTLVVGLADGRKFDRVSVLGADRRSDVAVLKLLDVREDLPVVALGDSDALEVGELVIAIGAPFGLDSSVSLGVVSATGRTGVIGASTSEDFIQTDAALNPGNSGGPLINLDGQVVGINTAIQAVRDDPLRDPRRAPGVNFGIGYAIPVNLARAVAVSLIEHGVARRGYLGVEFRGMLDPSALSALGIEGQGGVLLSRVEPDSPADKAGLKAGDVVIAVDGRPLRDIRILHARLAQAGPGGTVELAVHSGGGRRAVKVQLGEERTMLFGIEVATLDQERAATLGLPARLRGVVVTRVTEGSLAARAPAASRILPGDVIIGIDWRGGSSEIASREDFEEVMAEFQVRTPDVVRFWIVTREGRFAVLLEPGRDS